MKRISALVAVLFIISLWFLCNTTFADIYKYTDSEGQTRLTNFPHDPNISYTLVLKETPLSSKQTITDTQQEIPEQNFPIDIAGKGKMMDQPRSVSLVAAICVALAGVIAFGFFRFITKRKRANTESRKHRKDESQSETHKGDNQQDEQYQRWRKEDNRSSRQTWDSQSEEQRYDRVLGLKGKVAASDVKKAYRDLLAKYHPDKVHHLGDEFKHIADQKTREIIAAYEYFCEKYNIT